MRENILKYLVCPDKTKNKPCRNNLTLSEVFSFFRGGKKEIKEGYLKCKSCGARFPVFFGVPILVGDIPKYLRDNFSLILQLSKKYGRINKNLTADSLLSAKQAKPKDRKELFTQTKKEYARRIKGLFEDNYIISHYDDFLALAKPDEPLYDFLNRYRNKSPHLVLEEFLKSYSNSKNALALEIGCNVGGFLANLSKHAKIVFGMDNSFEHLFFTSCLLKYLPIKIDEYKVNFEASIKRKRPIKAVKMENLSLIAGKGDNLPFKDSSLSIVSSCNLIDVIDNPLGLLKEKIRVLKGKGLLLSSDPYQFLSENKKRLKIKKNQIPWQRIKEILKPKIKILQECDYTPWITRDYQRHYNIYYNHSFCGRKIR